MTNRGLYYPILRAASRGSPFGGVFQAFSFGRRASENALSFSMIGVKDFAKQLKLARMALTLAVSPAQAGAQFVTGKSCCLTIAVVTDTGGLPVRALVTALSGQGLIHHQLPAATNRMATPSTKAQPRIKKP